jgi:MFS transporter, ACS family, hexuronate transporter
MIAFGTLADRVFRRTGSQRRSYVYLVTALLMASALCLFLAVSVPSALGAVFFFTLVFIGVPIPILSTIISAVAPAVHRGAVLGIVVAVSTLPGIIAPLVTGLLIQATGKKRGSWISQRLLPDKPLTSDGWRSLPGRCEAR